MRIGDVAYQRGQLAMGLGSVTYQVFDLRVQARQLLIHLQQALLCLRNHLGIGGGLRAQLAFRLLHAVILPLGHGQFAPVRRNPAASVSAPVPRPA